MDSKKYKVSVEFEKYSKKFENVPEPKLDLSANPNVLIIEDRNRTFRFSMNEVQYYAVEEMK